ncbi:MAG TPA: PIG-L family deacetylase [Terriglobales bacterium]|nr:PIG-L family deacetylase [Terriglobales bacterium]
MDTDRLAQLLGRTLFIVAHPDDESISCGGLLQHVKEPCVVFATDGAPQDQYFWQKYGSREEYAALRQQEARAALASVGVSAIEFLSDQTTAPLIDQTLYKSLAAAFSALGQIVERHRPECLLTLAYEGGHPDHDAVSFLSAQLGRTFSIPVWEAPLYHRREDGTGVYQRFVEEHGEVIEHTVTAGELAAKMRMLASYRSQFEALPSFRPELERFRAQAQYDYFRRPHAGKLNYEVWQWRMTPEEVCAAFNEFSSVSTPLEK